MECVYSQFSPENIHFNDYLFVLFEHLIRMVRPLQPFSASRGHPILKLYLPVMFSNKITRLFRFRFQLDGDEHGVRREAFQ